MKRFTFDAQAALEHARYPEPRSNRPNRPNRHGSGGLELGGLGRLGTVSTSTPALKPYDLAVDHSEERAAIREYDGGQSRTAAARQALYAAAAGWGVPARGILQKVHEKRSPKKPNCTHDS